MKSLIFIVLLILNNSNLIYAGVEKGRNGITGVSGLFRSRLSRNRNIFQV